MADRVNVIAQMAATLQGASWVAAASRGRNEVPLSQEDAADAAIHLYRETERQYREVFKAESREVER